MTPLSLLGLGIALLGSILGLIGAWGTSSQDLSVRHFGFLCWIINGPCLVISMLGIAVGIWSGLDILIFVPLNACYWFTAMRGFLNTKSDPLRYP